jgi:hypothetical protein
VVHIDLGIAFEGGRLLPVPEAVPFRLSRDMVDGLGAEGVNGAMRACSELALRVMREAREAIITIVEVCCSAVHFRTVNAVGGIAALPVYVFRWCVNCGLLRSSLLSFYDLKWLFSSLCICGGEQCIAEDEVKTATIGLNNI